MKRRDEEAGQHLNEQENWDKWRKGIIGLGDSSSRKSYYPELQKKLDEIEQTQVFLKTTNMQLDGINRLQQSLLEAAPLEAKLTAITEGVVKHFRVDFCRIWIIRPGDRCADCVHAEVTEGTHICSRRDKCLHLLASSGRYTHTDGRIHRRVPFGCYMIGKIASDSERKFLISDATSNPYVYNNEWARELGLVSFAGYQLHPPGGESIGVLALFSQHHILPSEDMMLDSLSSAVALAVRQTAAEEALRQTNDELETRVAQRTLQLTHTNEQLRDEITERKALEQTLIEKNLRLEEIQQAMERTNLDLIQAYNELKEAQIRLVQSEKMATIGQLAAGVAHEINNPMGFITSNLGTMRKYAAKISQFLKLLDQTQASKNQGVLAGVRDKRKALNIDYILKDIDDLVAESQEGAQRVKKIVQDLKSFSRKDGPELDLVDINSCIESSLNIVWNEIKYKAEVVKELGELPQTLCFAQQLNQVFMNILVNASQAIQTKGDIRIRTWEGNGRIFVAISDTGSGIPEENLTKLFEPFFTTKAKDKGTGLGLAIVCDIIRKHNGDIKVESVVNQGTTFTIELPVMKEKESFAGEITTQESCLNSCSLESSADE